VCGPSVGLASVPLWLAILFWVGLWGVVGLILATPLTVCLAVLGKHVPQLEFLAVLLASRPVLRPEARYYQRLLARDRYEAAAVVKDYLTAHPADRLCDKVLVPALVLVRRGRRGGELQAEDEHFILQATCELLQGLEQGGPAPGPPEGDGRAVVLCLPARDEADEVPLLMLRHLSRPEGHDLRFAGGGALGAGVVNLVQQERPAVVFVSALAPGGLTEVRYLCRRLRALFPGLRIVVGRWGPRCDPKKARKLLLSAGADGVVMTLREARRQLAQLARVPAPPLRDTTDQPAAAGP
jgi:hypothetical protein